MTTTILRKAGRQSRLPLMKERPARAEIFCDVAHNGARLLAMDPKPGHDYRLGQLAYGLGQFTARIINHEKMHSQSKGAAVLIAIAAHCVGWLENSGIKADGFALIHREREYHEALFRTGKINFTCSSLTIDELRKLRTLMKCVGEVADEVERVELGREDALADLVANLVEVAAVVVAWLESLEVKP